MFKTKIEIKNITIILTEKPPRNKKILFRFMENKKKIKTTKENSFYIDLKLLKYVVYFVFNFFSLKYRDARNLKNGLKLIFESP